MLRTLAVIRICLSVIHLLLWMEGHIIEHKKLILAHLLLQNSPKSEARKLCHMYKG
jgi:hypothetical protein